MEAVAEALAPPTESENERSSVRTLVVLQINACLTELLVENAFRRRRVLCRYNIIIIITITFFALGQLQIFSGVVCMCNTKHRTMYTACCCVFWKTTRQRVSAFTLAADT